MICDFCHQQRSTTKLYGMYKCCFTCVTELVRRAIESMNDV